MCADLVLEGGCLCGNIRYRSVNAPVFVSHCHCQRCRRHSGALFVPLDGVLWARLSAYVYNELADYMCLGEALPVVLAGRPWLDNG